MDRRGALEAEDLLKLVLLLVVVWIALEILGEIIGLLGLIPNVLGIVIIVLVVLWLLDRI